MSFCEHIFSKEHPIGFRVSVIIEKQYLIVRVTKSSHSQVPQNRSRISRLQLFFKIGVLKVFKHFCWSLYLIKRLVFRATNLLKGDSNTGFFL